MKRKLFNFKISETLVARLRAAAKALDTSASSIAREAITEKLDALAEKYPELRAEQPATQQRQAA
jgi:predicted transcriptional regulator